MPQNRASLLGFSLVLVFAHAFFAVCAQWPSAAHGEDPDLQRVARPQLAVRPFAKVRAKRCDEASPSELGLFVQLRHHGDVLTHFNVRHNRMILGWRVTRLPASSSPMPPAHPPARRNGENSSRLLRFDRLHGSLHNGFAFELGDGSQHLRDQSTRIGPEVNCGVQDHQQNPLGVQDLNGIRAVSSGTKGPREVGRDNHVPLFALGKHAVSSGPVQDWRAATDSLVGKVTSINVVSQPRLSVACDPSVGDLLLFQEAVVLFGRGNTAVDEILRHTITLSGGSKRGSSNFTGVRKKVKG